MKTNSQPHEECPRCRCDLLHAKEQLPHLDELSFCPKCQFPLMLIAGKYRLEKVIGEGSGGTVYLAHHVRLIRDSERVVKVLRPELFRLPGMLTRFEREVQMTSSLSMRNEHIVRIYDDFGEDPQLGHFYVMEHLVGRTLSEKLEGPSLPPLEVCKHIFRQLCVALEAAHREEIIHRDLKPQNIFLIQRDEDDNFVKVLDFGIAKPVDAASLKITSLTQGPLGTPLYMSPEQCSLQDVSAQSDIYSLGIILYELLTGQTPFQPRQGSLATIEIAMAHMSTIPPNPSKLRPERNIPEELERVVLQALSKKPEDRPSSAKAFWEAIEHIPLPTQPALPSRSTVHQPEKTESAIHRPEKTESAIHRPEKTEQSLLPGSLGPEEIDEDVFLQANPPGAIDTGFLHNLHEPEKTDVSVERRAHLPAPQTDEYDHVHEPEKTDENFKSEAHEPEKTDSEVLNPFRSLDAAELRAKTVKFSFSEEDLKQYAAQHRPLPFDVDDDSPTLNPERLMAAHASSQSDKQPTPVAPPFVPPGFSELKSTVQQAGVELQLQDVATEKHFQQTRWPKENPVEIRSVHPEEFYGAGQDAAPDNNATREDVELSESLLEVARQMAEAEKQRPGISISDFMDLQNQTLPSTSAVPMNGELHHFSHTTPDGVRSPIAGSLETALNGQTLDGSPFDTRESQSLGDRTASSFERMAWISLFVALGLLVGLVFWLLRK